jgi:two-component system LytT family response regulator
MEVNSEIKKSELSVIGSCSGYPFCLSYQNQQDNKASNKIIVRKNNSEEIINCRDIIYCMAEGQYTWLYLINRNKILLAKALGCIEKELPNCFFRIHHGCILNMHFARSIEKSRGCEIILQHGISLQSSVRKKNQFIKALKKIAGKN